MLLCTIKDVDDALKFSEDDLVADLFYGIEDDADTSKSNGADDDASTSGHLFIQHNTDPSINIDHMMSQQHSGELVTHGYV